MLYFSATNSFVQKTGTTFAVVLSVAVPLLLVLSLDLTFSSAKAEFSNASIQIANLTDKYHVWKPFSSANVSQVNGNLTIDVITNDPQRLYNRAFLNTKLNSSINDPPVLKFDYESRNVLYPSLTKPIFALEIRDGKSSDILWTAFLNDTLGKVLNESFLLPSSVLNKTIELRLYTITEGGPTHSILGLRKPQIIVNNNESIDQYLNIKKLNSYPTSTENKTYSTRYDINGGKLIHVKTDEKNKILQLDINSTTNGILVVEVPRALIDAKKQSDIDAPFLITVDGRDSRASEIKNSNTTRVLAIEFVQGNKLVEIHGNRIGD